MFLIVAVDSEAHLESDTYQLINTRVEEEDKIGKEMFDVVIITIVGLGRCGWISVYAWCLPSDIWYGKGGTSDQESLWVL